MTDKETIRQDNKNIEQKTNDLEKGTNLGQGSDYKTNFVSRMIVPNKRLRLYVSNLGLEKAFDEYTKYYKHDEQAMIHAVSIINSNLRIFRCHFVVAGAWGEEKDRMFEFYGPYMSQDWKKEYETTWFFKNENLVSYSEIKNTENRKIFSRDFELIKAIEEQSRVKTKDLLEYMKEAPKIPALENFKDYEWIDIPVA